MITFLQGRLVEKDPTRVVLDVGGVGYEVFVPLSTFDQLPAREQPCRLLTYDHVREDLHQLYGFLAEEERRMFLLLMGTSGIGPRLALSALSGLSVRELTRAIVEGDVKRLNSVSGIGRKLAERIVVDLRDRIGEAEALEAVAGAATAEDVKARDAVLALVALGYKQAEARKLVSGVCSRGGVEAMTTEEIIKHALGG